MLRTFLFGPFRLDGRERALLRDGVRVPLTPRNFDVLRLLIASNNNLVTKSELLDRVWVGVHVDEAVLARAVSDLRKAITRPGDPPWIETVPKFGYRFRADVATVEAVAMGHTATAPAPASIATQPLPGLRGGHFAMGVAGLVLFAALAALSSPHFKGQTTPPVTTANFLLPLPGAAGVNLGGHSISPDGRLIAYAATVAGTETGIMLYQMDTRESRLLPGTAHGLSPFFSPDGAWVGFLDHTGYLKKVSLDGQVVRLFPARSMRGASWSPEGWIVAALGGETGLSRIPLHESAAGPPEPLTDPRDFGELTHRWPHVLPGSNSVIYTAHTGTSDFREANIKILSLRERTSKTILRRAYFARYAADGRLVFVRDGKLMAQNFDIARQQVQGEPQVIATELAGEPSVAYGGFDISAGGTLTYDARPDAAPMPLAWLGRDGQLNVIPAPPAAYLNPRISPDGTRAALQVGALSPSHELAIVNLRTGDSKPLWPKRAGVLYAFPAWAPDGNHVVFLLQDKSYKIAWAPASGGKDPRVLMESRHFMVPLSFTPDGRILIFSRLNQDSSYSLYAQTLVAGTDGRMPTLSGDPELLLPDVCLAALSPDGKWLAYEHQHRGQAEIYVARFHGRVSTPVRVSTTGGMSPKWSRHGRFLYFSDNEGQVVRASYSVKDGLFSPSAVERFVFREGGPRPERNQFELDPIHDRALVFAGNRTDGGATPINLTVLLNRFAPRTQ